MPWKTGTSYGRRDAWSIGYNREYTIGVWIGNFNGQGMPGAYGLGGSHAPALRLVQCAGLQFAQQLVFASSQPRLSLACAPRVGCPPGEHCPNQLIDYFLPGMSSAQRCQHQREVLVAADGAARRIAGPARRRLVFGASCTPI
ncbi:MAG: hypothetical protein WKG07_27630 [Hymenobacter sp.]